MSDECLFGLDLRAYLAGSWQIERQIKDRRTGRMTSFYGQAEFEAADDVALDYSENGWLDTGTRTLKASQRYHWSFDEGGAGVWFADGRPFHRVVIAYGAASAQHDCPPDLYRVAYAFEAAHHWRQTWHVTGPRKDYTLESLFTRLHRAPVPVQSPPK